VTDTTEPTECHRVSPHTSAPPNEHGHGHEHEHEHEYKPLHRYSTPLVYLHFSPSISYPVLPPPPPPSFPRLSPLSGPPRPLDPQPSTLDPSGNHGIHAGSTHAVTNRTRTAPHRLRLVQAQTEHWHWHWTPAQPSPVQSSPVQSSPESQLTNEWTIRRPFETDWTQMDGQSSLGRLPWDVSFPDRAMARGTRSPPPRSPTTSPLWLWPWL